MTEENLHFQLQHVPLHVLLIDGRNAESPALVGSANIPLDEVLPDSMRLAFIASVNS